MTKRTYYTMDDLEITDASKLKEVLIALNTEGTNTYADALASLMYYQYKDNWVTYSDQEFLCVPPTEEAEVPTAKLDRWKRQMAVIYAETYERYALVLDLYADNKEKLLDQLSSKTTTKMNDTPEEEGNYGTDEYTSSVGTSETLTDSNELITRIDTVNRQYRNVMRNWMNEFRKLYGEDVL